MRTLIVAAALVAAASASTHEELFASFKARHNKSYETPAEEERRFAIFSANMRKAAALNRRNPLATFGVNEFADVSASEFKVRHNGQKFYATKAKAAKSPKSVKKVEKKERDCGQVDWRKKNVVTPIKNQAQCGGCWAFSTTGNIEGQWALAGNGLPSLSEQELISCDTNDEGCNGGLMDNAFNWLLESQGGSITTEDAFPFTSGSGSSNGNCPSDVSSLPVGATITSYKDIEHDEDAIASAVCSTGPISIAVDATSFQTYTGGILTDCESSQIDHGVLIVGYDDTYSTPYWIIKNQWGASWGEDGYIRVEKGENECLLTTYPSTSVVESA